MRNCFAEEMTSLVAQDKRVMLLSGDIGNRLFDDFRRIAPDRFLNCGIAEGNMMGMAAGLSLSGMRPFVYTITPFTTTRCFEQIRVDVCYHNAPVIIVGTGSGLSYASLGPTHHSLEDVAIIRTLPGIAIYTPCDRNELRSVIRTAMRQSEPAYIRIGKKGEPDIFDKVYDVVRGQVSMVKPGERACILASGTIISEALAAREYLESRGFAPQVMSVPCIKPLATSALAEIAANFELIVTVEEHGRIGGLGGAVAEWRSASGVPVKHLLIGANDEFMHQVGSQKYARAHYGLDASMWAPQILQILSEKS